MSADSYWYDTAVALASVQGNSIDARIREAERSHEGPDRPDHDPCKPRKDGTRRHIWIKGYCPICRQDY